MFLDVDPRELRLPGSRIQGADPVKYHRELVQFGSDLQGMPTIFVYRGIDGIMQIIDGVTRATRAAKLRPGTLVRVEVVKDKPFSYARFPRVGDRLP